MMSSRLEYVQQWEALAVKAGYRPSDLASLCQISLRTLERHFQKNYGMTVSRWMRELRLGKAYESLTQGKSVKESAFDHGYKQVSHFSREFKNHFGVSPSFLLTRNSPGDRSLSPRQVSPSSPQMIFSF
jgi:AraC-like DNA-binding protein